MNKELRFEAATDIGKKYSHNEDYYILPEENEKSGVTLEKIEEKGSLFVLCDGMGGGNSGEVASELTAGWTIKGFYNSDDSSLEDMVNLKKIISGVNSKIFSLGREHSQYNGMCTTIVAAHIKESLFSICSVGDSRAYILRNKKLEQLTQDHSEVWSLYETGVLTKEELRNHPRNNVLSLAVGAKEKILEKEIFSYSGEVKKNDIIMLCSDGLTDMVCENEIRKVLVSFLSLKKKCKKLVSKANENGGKDNITLILIEPIKNKRFFVF